MPLGDTSYVVQNTGRKATDNEVCHLVLALAEADNITDLENEVGVKNALGTPIACSPVGINRWHGRLIEDTSAPYKICHVYFKASIPAATYDGDHLVSCGEVSVTVDVGSPTVVLGDLTATSAAGTTKIALAGEDTYWEVDEVGGAFGLKTTRVAGQTIHAGVAEVVRTKAGVQSISTVTKFEILGSKVRTIIRQEADIVGPSNQTIVGIYEFFDSKRADGRRSCEVTYQYRNANDYVLNSATFGEIEIDEVKLGFDITGGSVSVLDRDGTVTVGSGDDYRLHTTMREPAAFYQVYDLDPVNEDMTEWDDGRTPVVGDSRTPDQDHLLGYVSGKVGSTSQTDATPYDDGFAVTGANGSLVLAMEDFAEKAPKGFEVSGDRLWVSIFPEDFTGHTRYTGRAVRPGVHHSNGLQTLRSGGHNAQILPAGNHTNPNVTARPWESGDVAPPGYPVSPTPGPINTGIPGYNGETHGELGANGWYWWKDPPGEWRLTSYGPQAAVSADHQAYYMVPPVWERVKIRWAAQTGAVDDDDLAEVFDEVQELRIGLPPAGELYRTGAFGPNKDIFYPPVVGGVVRDWDGERYLEKMLGGLHDDQAVELDSTASGNFLFAWPSIKAGGSVLGNPAGRVRGWDIWGTWWWGGNGNPSFSTNHYSPFELFALKSLRDSDIRAIRTGIPFGVFTTDKAQVKGGDTRGVHFYEFSQHVGRDTSHSPSSDHSQSRDYTLRWAILGDWLARDAAIENYKAHTDTTRSSASRIPRKWHGSNSIRIPAWGIYDMVDFDIHVGPELHATSGNDPEWECLEGTDHVFRFENGEFRTNASQGNWVAGNQNLVPGSALNSNQDLDLSQMGFVMDRGQNNSAQTWKIAFWVHCVTIHAFSEAMAWWGWSHAPGSPEKELNTWTFFGRLVNYVASEIELNGTSNTPRVIADRYAPDRKVPPGTNIPSEGAGNMRTAIGGLFSLLRAYRTVTDAGFQVSGNAAPWHTFVPGPLTDHADFAMRAYRYRKLTANGNPLTSGRSLEPSSSLAVYDAGGGELVPMDRASWNPGGTVSMKAHTALIYPYIMGWWAYADERGIASSNTTSVTQSKAFLWSVAAAPALADVSKGKKFRWSIDGVVVEFTNVSSKKQILWSVAGPVLLLDVSADKGFAWSVAEADPALEPVTFRKLIAWSVDGAAPPLAAVTMAKRFQWSIVQYTGFSGHITAGGSSGGIQVLYGESFTVNRF